MTALPLPASPGELTVALLNKHLNESPNWAHGRVSALNTAPCGAAGGMSASVYMLRVTVENSNSLQLIAKLRDVARSPMAQPGCKAEVYFYRELADRAGVTSPRTYISEYDLDTNRMLLVQEFLTGGRIGTIETVLTRADVERVLSAMAGMHAQWWNSPELEMLTEVRTGAQAFRSGIERFHSKQYDPLKFLAEYGNRVDPEIARYYRSERSFGPELAGGYSPNVTLAHYDVTPKNLFLPDDPDRPPVFFDWELLVRGYVGLELANLLCTSIETEEHNNLPAMLEYYLGEMRALGVDDLTFETLWDDFRFGCLTRLAAPIALTSRGYPPANALALKILPAITSAVLATNAFELLE